MCLCVGEHTPLLQRFSLFFFSIERCPLAALFVVYWHCPEARGSAVEKASRRRKEGWGGVRGFTCTNMRTARLARPVNKEWECNHKERRLLPLFYSRWHCLLTCLFFSRITVFFFPLNLIIFLAIGPLNTVDYYTKASPNPMLNVNIS